MVRTKPGSQTITPTLTPTHARTRTHARNGWIDEATDKTDFLFGDKQENDTHLKMGVTDRLTD